MNLTTPGGGSSSPSHREARARTSTSLIKSLLTPMIFLIPSLRTRRKNDEGIIAPRTPVRGSPLHSPVQMSSSYFPWSEDTSANNYATALSPDSARNPVPGLQLGPSRKGSPAPPRRIQSEAQVTKSAVNPRGIATRNGKHVVSDAELVDEPESVLNERVGKSMEGAEDGGADDSRSPTMSLGPKGREVLGGVEVVESLKHAKPKAD